MPTIIDSLVVELGLDASKFDEGQKKAVEGLRKMEEATQKHVKPVTSEFDKLLSGFKEMQGRLLGIGALIASGLGLDRLIGDITKLTAETGYLAKSLGISAQELAKWENAGATVGATANDIASGISSIEKSFATMQLHGEGPLQKFAYATGLNFYNKQGQPQSPTEILMTLSEWSQKQKPAVSTQALSELGLGQGLIRLIQLGPQELKKRLDEMQKFGPSDEQIKKFQDLQEAFAKLTVSVDKLTRDIVSELAPALGTILKWIEKIVEAVGRSSPEGKTESDATGGFWTDSPFGRFLSRRLPGVRNFLGGGPASPNEAVQNRFGNWQNTPQGSAPGAVGAGGAGGAGGSNFLSQQRQSFMNELSDPAVRQRVAGMAVTEGQLDPTPVIESLANRYGYVNADRARRGLPPLTVDQMLSGGFYGPINRGELPGAVRQLQGNPELAARMENAIRQVGAGSNTIRGATDQGLPTDPNGMWPGGRMTRGGNIFNDWGGGPGGHAGAQTYREFLMAGVAREQQARQGTGGVPMAVATPGMGAAQSFANWAAINRMSGARSAIEREGDSSTTNNTSTSQTHIGEMHVTVPPGASADDYAYRIQGVLQRNDPVQQAVTGQR
jgi:chaperonin cofactor prefoldin